MIARVNSAPIAILRRSRRPVRDARQPRRAVDLVVARHLAAVGGAAARVDTSPELAARIDALRREAAAREESLLRDALFASLRDEIALGEDELRAHYEKTKVHYSERQLRLRRQPFESAEAAREADAKLGPAGRLDPAASEELGPASVAKLPQAGAARGAQAARAGRARRRGARGQRRRSSSSWRSCRRRRFHSRR